MFSPTKQQIRQLRRDNAEWPATLREVPRDQWPREVPGVNAGEVKRERILRSRDFLVQVFSEPNDVIRLTVNRTDWDENLKRFREDISWDALMDLKRQAGYDALWGTEVFPPSTEVVNVANMRHVWLTKEAPAFAWVRRAQEVAA